MTDRRIPLLVIIFLGVFALLGLAGTVWLIDHARDASNIAIVSGLTGTALGGLAGILSSVRSGPPEVTPVTVVNAPADPVPTTDAGP